MVASIWLRAAHRGVPNFLVTALVLGQSPMALAESPAQRQELIAALRQLDALERTVADSVKEKPFLFKHKFVSKFVRKNFLETKTT